jgi:hypothetical protein
VKRGKLSEAKIQARLNRIITIVFVSIRCQYSIIPPLGVAQNGITEQSMDQSFFDGARMESGVGTKINGLSEL